MMIIELCRQEGHKEGFNGSVVLFNFIITGIDYEV
jgi:hypothetical protein